MRCKKITAKKYYLTFFNLLIQKTQILNLKKASANAKAFKKLTKYLN
jgi:hypothetical protein